MKTSTASSGFFNPRLLLALALCACGVLLGMFSLASTPPVEAPRANTSVPPDPANFLSTSTSGSNANHLPPGVPLPPGALNPESVRGQFSPNGRGDPSSGGPTAGFPGVAGMPLGPSGLDAPPGRKSGTASGANSLANPWFANQQLAPLSVQQPAASESMPLASGAQSDWSIVNSPNTPPGRTPNYLFDVTCVSASDCWAVGYSGFTYTGTVQSVEQTLIEHWDGTSWAIVPSPDTTGSYAGSYARSYLHGVTCVSASDCWAVGYYSVTAFVYQTLIEHWDGTSWAIVSSPNIGVQTNQLFDVTCVSASDCWAVGAYGNGVDPDTGLPIYQTLIERWDGTSWAIVSSPNNSATRNHALFGVTCVSASDCWAIGYSNVILPDDSTYFQTLIERWDGTSWAIVNSPNSTDAIGAMQQNTLSGVTCVSASDCWAVGYYDNGNAGQSGVYQTLIERWDGTSWAIVTSPNNNPSETTCILTGQLPGCTQQNVLNSLTCASASDCWAIGYYFNTNDDGGVVVQTLIERWDGASWAIVSSPNTSTTQGNILYGVMCVPASECWAVGYYNNGNPVQSGGHQALIERWDGTSWAIVTSPNTSAVSVNALAAVTCVSASDCWAVGRYYNGSVFQTLIEHWDGTSWAIVSSPNTSATRENLLLGVTCVSASECWAVGGYDAGFGTAQTLIERWDGTSWAIVPSPNANISGGALNVLLGVTCPSASDCWAVGYYINASNNANQTLIERWDGASWAIVSSPNASSENNYLVGVTCLSASNCWAVGYYNGDIAVHTLIEHWDGTSWAIVPSPNKDITAAADNLLAAVTCVSASDCWAVGYYYTQNAVQTLIERWDGTSWAIVTSANTSPTRGNFFGGVTCVSASDCWAVGYDGTYQELQVQQTLIERWDGTSWAIVTSPNTNPTQTNVLSGVTCVSAGTDCWAVGYFGGGQGLVLRYTVSPPIPTSVVSRKTHGAAGNFDINLPLTGEPGIESRQGQGTNSDEHQVVLTFPAPATVASAACDGTPATTSTSGNDVTVNCTGVANGKIITVALTGVTVGANSGNVSVPMGLLTGDTTADRFVNSADISQTKSQSGSAVTNSNFREDLTVEGFLNSADISLVKSKSGTALP